MRRRSLFALTTLVLTYCLMIPVPALAYTTFGMNYADQYTANGSAGYYGWLGVRGGIYWANYGTLRGGSSSRYDDSFCMMNSDGSQITAGYTRSMSGVYGTDGSYAGALTPMIFRERFTYMHDYREQALHFVKIAPIPSHEYFTLDYKRKDATTGHYVWGVLNGDGRYAEFDLPAGSGMALAGGEIWNSNATNTKASAYYGTDKAGYNTTGSHALYLKNGIPAWELWDTTLRAYGTAIEDDHPYHYSPGYHWYYFGVWNI